jgi:hypothetical protein
MFIDLVVRYHQVFSPEIVEIEGRFDLDEINSYGFDGEVYYIEVVDPLFFDTELIEITHASYLKLVEAMENKHN